MRRILAAVPAPMAVAERQLQLWSTPHGVAKAALAHNATVQAHTIAFTLPDRITLKAAVGGQGLIEKVEAAYPHPVVGDMPVEVPYAEDRDFGGVKFPTRIRQTAGGFPALELLPMTDLHRAAGHSH
jgi:hypothetical protein